MSQLGIPIILSGPSGVGKNTVIRALLARESRLRYSISTTTRAPRPGEREGYPYCFVSTQAFEDGIRDGRFVEYAQVYGAWYGTDRELLEAALADGSDMVLDVDTQGAAQLFAAFPDSLRVYLMPPSQDELARRLRARKTEDEASVERRLAEFDAERRTIHQYTHVVINDEVEVAASDISAIIRAEHLSRARAIPRLLEQGWTL